MNTPTVPAGLYQHYKGKRYLVFGIAEHEETREALVIYAPLYVSDGPALWARPLAVFMESVEVDGVVVPRFTYLGAPESEETEELPTLKR